MKKGWKITIIIVSVIVALLLLVSLLVSPIAKWYIEKNSKDLVGRKITIENLDIRLLLGRAKVENFVLYEPNETDTFASIGYFDADVSVWGILRKNIVVDYIKIDAPQATILRENNSLNFDDILTFFANKSAGSDSTTVESVEPDTTAVKAPQANSWGIILRNIALDNGNVRYADDILDIDWTMHHIKLDIPEIDLSGRGANLQLYLDFARGGHLDLKAMYEQSSMDYDLECQISEYPLGVLMPFVKNAVNVGDISGSMNLALHAQGNIENIMA
ncbi:MAG: AsmA family protein, partial [Bacteroidales bacterium]|nr:AsmA family protein [Bacteroidales bacterium]